jgi:hypothetical protein
MKIALLILLLAAPAFAHRDDDGYAGEGYAGDDDASWQQYADEDQIQPAEQQGPTLDDFRSDGELSWNGDWIDTPEYGTVWRPTRVASDWQPYLYGRWAWTRVGWAWVSEEPFGWAVYHYGRWAWSPAGWVWLPGRVWAPAWVAWRYGEGYTGWCPLGPRATVVDQPALWVYVGQRHFLDPVRHHVIPRQDRGSLFVPIHQGGPRAGPPIAAIERATGRSVRPLPISDTSSPRGAQAGGGGASFYRPRTAPVQVPAQGPHARQGEARPMPQRPGYYGGAPAQTHGGAPRPQAQGGGGGRPAPAASSGPAPAPVTKVAPHAVVPSISGQETTHARER